MYDITSVQRFCKNRQNAPSSTKLAKTNSQNTQRLRSAYPPSLSMCRLQTTRTQRPDHEGMKKLKVQLRPLLTSTLDGGDCSTLRSGRLNPNIRALGNKWTGGCEGSTADPKSADQRIVSCRSPSMQPSHCTNWAILVRLRLIYRCFY